RRHATAGARRGRERGDVRVAARGAAAAHARVARLTFVAARAAVARVAEDVDARAPAPCRARRAAVAGPAILGRLTRGAAGPAVIVKVRRVVANAVRAERRVAGARDAARFVRARRGA